MTLYLIIASFISLMIISFIFDWKNIVAFCAHCFFFFFFILISICIDQTKIYEIFFYLIFFSPLISSILSGFSTWNNSKIFSISCLFISLTLSFILLHDLILGNYTYYGILNNWIKSGNFTCVWGFVLDPLTLILLNVVLSISLLVHLYSFSYMKSDPNITRFFSFLSLFTFFMLVLITADNFIQMFIGWEGVGFCSYLLINFWFTRLQANKAAIKAMLVNRVSDFFLILGFLIIFTNLKSVDYASIFASIPFLKDYTFSFFKYDFLIIDIITIFILIGAMGKSAQLFLHIWLPDAMEGPTPVSALIHAATMVTAGIFLIIRCSPIFEYSTFTLNLMVLIGSMTAFFASSIGLVQNDLKKIIAYSTCSQLGYMLFSCGLSNYSFSIFHLFNHAFFKALLFLCAGSVIHALSDEQDIRKMGGLRRLLPYTYSLFLIGSLSLMGFPFLTGFYSKDSILETAFASYNLFGHFAYWLGTISACFTAFYSIRLLYLVFLSETNAYKQIILKAHEVSFLMGFPLAILSVGSIFIGYVTKDMFIGLGTNFWQNSIFIHPIKNISIDFECLPIFFKLLPIIFSFFGFFLAIYLYYFNFYKFYKFLNNFILIKIYNFLNKKWLFDKIYNEYLNQNFLKIGYLFTYKFLDKGVFELLGASGISNTIYNISSQLIKLQTGFIYHYSLILLISIILFLFIFIFNLYLFFFYFNLIFLLLNIKK